MVPPPAATPDRGAATAPPPRAGEGRQTQQLIVTILALYGRGETDSITVAQLIRLLAAVDVDDASARSALSRLKKRGVLISTRVDGAAAYRLDPELEEVFAEGDERIFQPRRSRPEDRWLLTAFSVPESRRHLRHQIRKILAKRGFGTVGSGLSVAPMFVYEAVRRDLERAGLLDYVEFFAAEHLTGEHMAEKVAAWWDLAELTQRYVEFCDRFEPLAREWQALGVMDEDRQARAFADYVVAVTQWRRLPYLDPGLPPEYLPEHWPGLTAESLFRTLHERLATPARRHAESVIHA